MTSNINFSAIDKNFPVSGKDNDSQGFRDNFKAIADGLEIAKGEITGLQNTAVVTASSENDQVKNDFNGSMVTDGLYSAFYGNFKNLGNAATDIDIKNGHLQLVTITDGPTTLRFINWPADGDYYDDNGNVYGIVRLHIKSDGGDAYTVVFDTEDGDIVKDNNFPGSFSVTANQNQKVIEAWSYNNGATVFLKYLGEFA